MAVRPRYTITTALWVLLALLLAACSSTPTSRYSQKYDAAPPLKLDPERIRDAEPRPELIKAAGNKSPYQVNGKHYRVMSEQQASRYRQQGTASWYGTKFHGHLTSNGETYNMYRMSAAHKSLPIPCYVKVTNLDNGRAAIVRVNDRGPFHGGRIIDLSYAAATKLGYADKGVARVSIEVIDARQHQLAGSKKPPRNHQQAGSAVSAESAAVDAATAGSEAASASQPYLQAAAFSQLASAEALREQLLGLLDTPVTISSRSFNSVTLHRVRIGPLDAQADAERIRQLLMLQNLGKPHLVYD
jgi:rare lipoprotein A